MGSLVVGLMAGRVHASTSRFNSNILDRDKTYEEDLRWEAADDKAVTPARFMRWMHGSRGSAVFDTPNQPTSTEFVPIVGAKDGQFRALGAIAFKFK